MALQRTIRFFKHAANQLVTRPLANPAGGTFAVNWNGPATLELAGVNTYTGGTNVKGGTVQFDRATLPSGLRIVMIGDSITAGGGSSLGGGGPSTGGGWAAYLYQLLTTGGPSGGVLAPGFSFLGNTNNTTHVGGLPAGYQARLGYSGYDSTRILANFAGNDNSLGGNSGGYWLTSGVSGGAPMIADVIMYQGGINDSLYAGNTAASAQSNLNAIINYFIADTLAPGGVILIGKIIASSKKEQPSAGVGSLAIVPGLTVSAYNAMAAATVATFKAGGTNIVLVHNNDENMAADSYDSLHPSDTGHAKIARAFCDAICLNYGVSCGTSAINIGAGGTVNAFATIDGNVVSGTGALSVNGARNVVVSGTLTESFSTSGQGKTFYSGSGNLILNGTSTATGSVSIGSGITATATTTSSASNKSMNLDGTLDMALGSIGVSALRGGGTATNTSASNRTLSIGTTSQNCDVFTGTITNGSGGAVTSLLKTGHGVQSSSPFGTYYTGVQQLAGTSPNTFTGTTSVNSPIAAGGQLGGFCQLVLNKSAGVQAIGGNLTIGNGTGGNHNGVSCCADGQLPASCVVTFLSSAGTNQTLSLRGTSQTIASLNDNTGRAWVGGSFAPGGGYEYTGFTTNSVLTVAGSSAWSFNGLLSDGVNLTGGSKLALNFTGTGVGTISGANTYTGPTAITGNRLVISNATALGTSAVTIVGNTTNFASQQLAVGAFSFSNPITLTPNGTLGTNGQALVSIAAGGTLSGAIVFNTSVVTTVAAGGIVTAGTSGSPATLSGAVTQTGSGASFGSLGGFYIAGTNGWIKCTNSINVGTSPILLSNSGTHVEFGGVLTGGLLNLRGSSTAQVVNCNATNVLNGILVSGTGAAANQINLTNMAGTTSFDQTVEGLTGIVYVTSTTGTPTLTVNGSSSNSSSGVISGATALTVSGTGTQTLTGINTATGQVTVAASSNLVIGGAGTYQSAPFSVGSGGTVTFSSTASPTMTGLFSGAGSMLFNGGGTNAIGSATVANTISGGITVTGTNTKVVNSAGTANFNCLGSGVFTIGAGATFSTNGYQCTSGPSSILLAGTISNGVSGGTSIIPSSTPITMNGAATVTVGSSTGVLTINGTIDCGGFALTSSAVGGAGTGVVNLNGVISNGVLVVVGPSKTVLTPATSNTFSGGITVSSGTLQNGVPASTTINSLGTGPISIAAGATLNFNAYRATTVPSSITCAGTMTSGSSSFVSLAAGCPVTLSGASTVSCTSTGSVTVLGTLNLSSFTLTCAVTGTGGVILSGVVSGTTGGITKTGANALTLGATNTYTGVTAVQAGSIVVTSATKINASSRIDITVANAAPTSSNSGTVNWGASPNFTGKTVNIIITETGTGITFDVGTWSGIATGTPSIQVNGVPLTMSLGSGTTAGGTTVQWPETLTTIARVTR